MTSLVRRASLALDRAGIARLTDGLIEADPKLAERIERALRGGVGLTARRLVQRALPGVAFIDVTIGMAPQAVRRIVALYEPAGLVGLWGDDDAFGALAVGRSALPANAEEAWDYARLFLEVTAPADVSLEWLRVSTPSVTAGVEAVRGVLCRDPTDAMAVLRRLGRCCGEVSARVRQIVEALEAPTERGPVAQRLLEDAGFLEGELATLAVARRLPLESLEPHEGQLLRRAARCFPPHGPVRYVRWVSGWPQLLSGELVDERVRQVVRGGDGWIDHLDEGPGRLLSVPAWSVVAADAAFDAYDGGLPVSPEPGRVPVFGGAAPLPDGAELYEVAEFGGACLLGCWSARDGAWLAHHEVAGEPDETAPWMQEARVREWLGDGLADLPRVVLAPSGGWQVDVAVGMAGVGTVGARVECLRLHIRASGAVDRERLAVF